MNFNLDTLAVQQYILNRIFLNVFFKRNYLSNYRLEFNNMVLWEIFGGKMELFTGGWRKFQ